MKNLFWKKTDKINKSWIKENQNCRKKTVLKKSIEQIRKK